MKAFAELVDGLSLQPGRAGKLRLLVAYLAATPDPDRGYGIAALTGGLALRKVQPKLLREMAETRVDPVLLSLSQDFVGDWAETVALTWPAPGQGTVSLSTVVEELNIAGRVALPGLLTAWLDDLDGTARWALLKLVTRGLRTGVSADLAREALAQWGGVPLWEIEGLWHGLAPPFTALFAWLEKHGPKPDVRGHPVFHSFKLTNPLAGSAITGLNAADYRAAWQWDGLRVQLVGHPNGEKRLYGRNGDDISAVFPDVIEAMAFTGVLDGELLVKRDGQIAPFDQLQKRLNRKRVDAALCAALPAYVRLHDMLFDDAEDLRPLPFDQRRTRLEDWYGRGARQGFDLSPLIEFGDWAELDTQRRKLNDPAVAGLMLKRGASAYLAGQSDADWFTWTREALRVSVVLMYVQQGVLTFGCWRQDRDDAVLVPVGKARLNDKASGDALDQWVRKNTSNRFGPVREVTPGLVFEITCTAIDRSTRHRAGLQLRHPEIMRIDWERDAGEADWVGKLLP